MVFQPGGGVLPYIGYVGMCGAKGMVFYPFWSEKRVWFVHSSLNLELGMFFRRSYFFIIRRACYALIDLRVRSVIG